MSENLKKKKFPLVSSISTGAGGVDFERRIQAFFIVQMILGGYVPTLPTCKLTKVLCQGRNQGFHIDDCVIFGKDMNEIEHKLLVQCKLSVSIPVKLSKSNKLNPFLDTVKNAWLDFSGNRLFDENLDKIALITGSLSKSEDGILEIFRDIHMEQTAVTFWEKYNGLGFNKTAKNKMNTIIDFISQVNNNVRPTDYVLFNFFKVFYILRSDFHEDLLEHGGINLSLLQTELNNQADPYMKSPQEIWNGLRTYLSEYNRLSIPIELSNLPGELKDLFAHAERTHQSQDFTAQEGTDNSQVKTNEIRISSSYKKELMLMALIGAFNQNNPSDMETVKELFGVTNSNSVQKILQSLFAEGNLNNIDGIWKIKVDQKKVVNQFGDEIFDVDIDAFKTISLQILGEKDTALNLSEKQHLAANLFSKNHHFSKVLRNGIANGMAIIANNENKLSNCSPGKVTSTAFLVVQELLKDFLNPNVWAELNDVLTPVAEIFPREFLKIVEKIFPIKNNPFINFSNEYSPENLFSPDYLSSLRWALMDLAWSKDYFAQAALLLAKLAELEKDNDPYNHQYALTALIEILLPWYPQTMAEPSNRISVVKSILKYSPAIGWELLKDLLPNNTTHSTGHPKPLWYISIPTDWSQKQIPNNEYWVQEEQYTNLFVSHATELSQIIDLIQNADSLTEVAFELFIKKLNILATGSSLSVSGRNKVWNALLNKIHNNEHQMSEDAQYALPKKSFEQLSALAETFTPQDKIEKYKRLFDSSIFDLYDSSKDWRENEVELEKQRVAAMKNLVFTSGFETVIRLADEVLFPYQVGHSLGKIDGYDAEVLPHYIDNTDSHKAFTKGYIDGCFFRAVPFDIVKGMKWVNSVNLSGWTEFQIAEFLVALPFKRPIWDILDRQTLDTQNIYWQQKDDFRDLSDQEYSNYPFLKLLDAKRPLAAMKCFQESLYYYSNKKVNLNCITEINVNMCRQILLNLIESNDSRQSDKLDSQMFHYYLMRMIVFLQQKLPLTDSGLWIIEWNFLPLFNEHNKEIPKTIIYSIENDPEVFHQMIKTVFRSTKIVENVEENRTELSEQVSKNIFNLTIINNFEILPGRDENREFNPKTFNSWIEKVKTLCEESGHWDTAQETIGRYLINAPEDSTGLFIHKSVANALDLVENEEMRRGYNLGIMNNLGVQTVDPSGKVNYYRSDFWNQRADKMEKSGFIRFAASLRDLAKEFKMVAQRDINIAKKFDNDIYE